MSLFDSGIDPKVRRAVDELRQRLQSNPTDTAAALSLSSVLAQAGHRREAIGFLSRTGAALQKKGKLVEAMALYRRVGEIDPKGEITSSFLIGLDLRKLQDLSAPAPAPAPAPPPTAAETEAAAARKAKAEAVRTAASGIPLLKDVPPFLLELVLDRISLRHASSGDVLFAEGEPGESLVFVVAGELDVFGGGTPLGRLGPGDVAGEISFLSGIPRTATLRAASEVDVLELERKAVDPILKKHKRLGEALAALYRERVLDGVLARSRAFGGLPAETRAALATRMTRRAARPGEPLIREGEQEDALFLVARGQARVTRRKGGRAVALAILGPLDVFGDVAALRGTPRTATVTAVTPMELLVLSRAALLELLDEAPSIGRALEDIQIERFVATAQALSD